VRRGAERARFVPGIAGGDNVQLVKRQLRQRRLRQRHMGLMRRVKCPTINANAAADLRAYASQSLATKKSVNNAASGLEGSGVRW